jgi:hypothetical protein
MPQKKDNDPFIALHIGNPPWVVEHPFTGESLNPAEIQPAELKD